VGVYESTEAADYDGEPVWHIGQSNRPVLIFQEVIRDLSQTYVDTASPPLQPQSRADIEKHIVLHEVLHRFLGGHGTKPPMTDRGNMIPRWTIVGTDTDNALLPLQLKGIQEREPIL
jgi:hypothetical protein